MGDKTAIGLDFTAARGADLEQNAQGSIDLGIGRALADIEIIKAFLGGVEPRFGIQEVGGVLLSDPVGQIARPLGDQRIATQRFTGVEVERAG